MASKNILKFTQVDAFSRSPFRGRTVAVAILTAPLADDARRQVAAELGTAETAYLFGENGRFELWSEPAKGEPDLYVSAALAAAHVLWTEGQAGHIERLSFMTPAGELMASKRADHVSIEAPARPPRPLPEAPPLPSAAGLRFAGNAGATLLLELANEAAVITYAASLAALAEGPYARLVVTARSATTLRDFVSRTFCKTLELGVPTMTEAPISGSAHTLLGPYWLGETGSPAVMGEGLGARGGFIHCELGTAPGRLHLSAQAITTFKSMLLVSPLS